MRAFSNASLVRSAVYGAGNLSSMKHQFVLFCLPLAGS